MIACLYSHSQNLVEQLDEKEKIEQHTYMVVDASVLWMYACI